MTEIKHRTIKTNGINMHIAEAGEGPVVLMLHGFPELWYSYRHQIPALADAGYHAVAPDVRGYGQSDAPPKIEDYGMKDHLADALGILDALDAETAVVVGHDWGAPMAWNSAALYPERYRAVVGMSVPFLQRSPAPPTQLFKQVFQDNFFYMLYFQEPGVAEKEFEADVRGAMRRFLFSASGDSTGSAASLAPKKSDSDFFTGLPEAPEKLPAWLTEDDVDYFANEFKRTGFRGGLNRYRNMDRDWNDLPELASAKITQPALFIGGERDPVVSFTSMDAMKANVPNLTTVILPGAGHWTQQERPKEVNEAMIKFLNGLD
jgi:pimeloyl-ACP methyl ester carboxylesterase